MPPVGIPTTLHRVPVILARLVCFRWIRDFNKIIERVPKIANLFIGGSSGSILSDGVR